jgi:hypothetical protein
MPREWETREQRESKQIEDELDWELEQTFPASDALKITRSAPRTQITPKQCVREEGGMADDAPHG